VILRVGHTATPELEAKLQDHVRHVLGAIAVPAEIAFPDKLPKTRSAKIMRRLLRDIAEGRVLGDTSTLLDPNIVAQIKEQYESTEG